MILGMAMAMTTQSVILGFARWGEEEAHQHAERDRDEFEPGARAPP
jgi:hypothetical protein